MIPANYLQPISRASNAYSGAITVKEQNMRQKMDDRHRADSVCSISKNQAANIGNADNLRLVDGTNQHNLVSPLNKGNHLLTALTPMEIDPRVGNYDNNSINYKVREPCLQ